MYDLRKLRIAFVVGSLGQGGAEQQLFYILRTARDAGANVRVLCLTQHEFWEARIRALGIAVHFVGEHASRIARLARVVAELRVTRPQIVQSQHFYTNLYAVAAARMLRLKEIGAIRNDAVSEVEANGRLLGNWSLKLPKVLAANSRLGMSNAVAMGVSRARIRFLPNVVDTDHFTPPVPHTGTTFRLLAVGRLTQQKRFDRFIEILARLRWHWNLDVRATIVGSGPLRATLEAQAKGLGLRSPELEFAGTVADMRSLYQQADVLALTSQWEGTPNVVMEGMASGLVVVATRVGGVADLICDNETGVLINGYDDAAVIEGFCRVLVPLINAPERRMTLANAGRASIVETHALKELPGFLSELYESVLA